MKSIILVLIFTLSALLFSCNSNEEFGEGHGSGQGSGSGLPPLDAPPALNEGSFKFSPPAKYDALSLEEDDVSPVNQSATNKKKIIKDGRISFKANDINASKKAVDELINKYNAYYESEDLQNDEQSVSYDLQIRVPADNFENLIAGIENGSGEVISKSIQARDVTEEFIDIETRLINKRDYLKRYKEILTRASTVKDIMAIEENIRVLQEEIESKEGRLKYLTDQVTYSTLKLNLFKNKEFIYKPVQPDKFSERTKKSLSSGWDSILNSVLWLISKWPYIIAIFVILFFGRRLIKK